jgi:O-antigen biosynthesis protein WbqV
MIGFAKFTPRMWLILAHDLLVTLLAVLAAFYIRFEDTFIDQRRDHLIVLLPAIVVCGAIVYLAFGLNKSKWRFCLNSFRSCVLPR